MYFENTSLSGEKIVGKYGAITLTNRRVIGQENVIDLALGGLGKIISRFLGFSSRTVGGTVTEIRLDKIDSIRLSLDRQGLILKISNLLWFVTLFLLVLIWLIAPYRAVSTAFINVVGFILNLITLGFLKGVFEPLLGSLLSLVSGSYEIPVMTFAGSVLFFIVYVLVKTIRLEIHSAKNFAFTNILDLSVKGGLEQAQKFAKKVREAENDYKKR
ncbi:MAG: hypothetical protein HY517_02090 [Candidatus Aenigmarchaeota archaeon]|nr:hypothetical protein [Candidatus Aenigmarchaeota archaeon]